MVQALTIVFLAGALLARPTGTEAATTLAVIPGEGEQAPSADLVIRLEAALSATPDLALVERAQIRRILAEQQLAAGGWLKPGISIQLGRLLAADLFLFLNRIAAKENAGLEARWVEAKTGVILERRLLVERIVESNWEPVLALHRSALARMAVPFAERHPIAILSFRREEPGRALDGPVAALEAMLAADLSANPSLLLLEREHLDQLVTEKHLAGGELDLAASALLLEGGIRHSPDKREWVITVRLKPLSGGEAGRTNVTVAAGNLSAARSALGVAWGDHFKLALKPGAPPADAKREAAVFSQHASLLVAHGEMMAGVRAAEAALALCPCQEHRLQAGGAWAGLSGRLLAQGYATTPERKRQVLKASLRMWDLQEVLVAEHLARYQRKETHPVPLPLVPSYTVSMGALDLPVEPRDAETDQLRAELQRACLTAYRSWCQHYADHWDERTPANRNIRVYSDPRKWWGPLLNESIGHFAQWTDDVHEWAALVKDAVVNVDGPPGREPAHEAFQKVGLYWRLCGSGNNPAGKFSSPEQAAVVTNLYDSLCDRGNPRLHLSSLVAKMHYNGARAGKPDVATAKAVLDLFLAEYWKGDLAQRRQRVDGYIKGVALAALHHAWDTNYVRAILDPILEARDSAALSDWEQLPGTLLASYDYTEDREEAFAWLERLLPVLHNRPPLNAAERTALRQQLQGVNVSMGLRMGRFYEVRGEWNAYEVEQLRSERLEVVPIRATGPRVINRLDFPKVMASAVDHDRLLLAWALGFDMLWVTAVPLAGGPESLLGRTNFSLPFDTSGAASRIRGIATDASTVYLATGSGLVMVRDGNVIAPQQDPRLPSGNALSLASLGGKLFLGLWDGGLLQWDPASGETKTLASSRSLDARHRLDGGDRYVVPALLADEQRKCLWFLVSPVNKPGPQLMNGQLYLPNGMYHGPRYGLWRYHPSTGRMEQATRDGLAMDRMDWQQGKIVSLEMGMALYLTDPDTLRRTTLFNPAQHLTYQRGPAMFAKAPVPLWPCAWTGEHLMVSGDYAGYLHLLAGPRSHAATLNHEPVQEVMALHQMGDTILAVTTPGDIWRIRKKALPVAGLARAAQRKGESGSP